MSTRSLLTLLILSAPVLGCNTKGTCIMTDKSEGPVGFDFCWIQYYESACRDAGEREKTEVEFFKEDATAGFVRCQAAGFRTDEPQAEIERKIDSGNTVSSRRPKSVQ